MARDRSRNHNPARATVVPSCLRPFGPDACKIWGSAGKEKRFSEDATLGVRATGIDRDAQDARSDSKHVPSRRVLRHPSTAPPHAARSRSLQTNVPSLAAPDQRERRCVTSTVPCSTQSYPRLLLPAIDIAQAACAPKTLTIPFHTIHCHANCPDPDDASNNANVINVLGGRQHIRNAWKPAFLH